MTRYTYDTTYNSPILELLELLDILEPPAPHTTVVAALMAKCDRERDVRRTPNNCMMAAPTQNIKW